MKRKSMTKPKQPNYSDVVAIYDTDVKIFSYNVRSTF